MVDIKSIYDKPVQDVLKDKFRKYHASPEAWEDQLLYFLLPDRFSDNSEKDYLDNSGNPVTTGTTPAFKLGDNGDAIKTPASTTAWLDAGARFCGGTLNGVRSKLGYLQRLGVTALWIGPIFKQVAALETYHGYGVQNFLDVDPRFGTREQLRDLVSEAHGMGIYIILDIILNHTGNIFAYDIEGGSPVFDGGRQYPVKGYFDNARPNRQPSLPFGPVDLTAHPDAFPDSAIWPAELQPPTTFTQKGRIGDNSNHWDTAPEYLDGDFYDLKDVALGPDAPDGFVATPALKTLVSIYKYWIAYADLDAFRLDTVKHMGFGPTRYFAGCVHEFAAGLGKERFLIAGEITGGAAWQTVEATGLDCALGIGGLQQSLWTLGQGGQGPQPYFDLFRNATFLRKGSHAWLRDRVVTMLDDHDQVWRSGGKGRFCAEPAGATLVAAVLVLNMCTLGIPCVYYGSEQAFDGSGGDDRNGHAPDQYIREAMFGGGFGAFRSKGAHFFDEGGDVYRAVAAVARLRKDEVALRRGRQYLREISGSGDGWGYPQVVGDKMRSVVAWSRIFDEVELLCAVNTDPKAERTAWVTVDHDLHVDGDEMQHLYPAGGPGLAVEERGDRMVVKVTVPPGGFVVYK